MTLRAYHQGSFVHVEVADDGRGMDPALLRERAARQGFLSTDAARRSAIARRSTWSSCPASARAGEVTTTSGRGVGMDVVRTNVGRLNGEIDLQSEPGSGTRITIKLPLTVVISDALLVRSGGETFAVPMHAIRSIVQVRPEDIARGGRPRARRGRGGGGRAGPPRPRPGAARRTPRSRGCPCSSSARACVRSPWRWTSSSARKTSSSRAWAVSSSASGRSRARPSPAPGGSSCWSTRRAWRRRRRPARQPGRAAAAPSRGSADPRAGGPGAAHPSRRRLDQRPEVRRPDAREGGLRGDHGQ